MSSSKIAIGIAWCAGLLACAGGRAEDIDLFAGANNTAGSPNVIVVIENTDNWERNAQHWPGGLFQGQSELKALRLVIDELPDDVNLGLMMFTPGDETLANHDGGYVRFHLRPMTTANRQALRDLIGPTSACSDGPNAVNGTPNCIYQNFNGGEQVDQAKADYGAMMFEVFKYLGGYTSPAHARDDTAGAPLDKSHFGPFRFGGLPDSRSDASAFAPTATADLTTYNSFLGATNSCSNTYVVFIGNGFPRKERGYPLTQPPETLLAGVGGDTTQLPMPQMRTTLTTVETELATTACGAYTTCPNAVAGLSSGYPSYSSFRCEEFTTTCTGSAKRHRLFGIGTRADVVPTGLFQTPSGADVRYADEWAKYLYQTDVSAALGQQNVVTFTIDVFKDAQDSRQTQLLYNMAQYGGGKYFAATNEDAIVSALRNIFADIQSANSAFSSSSLPVSVNTQGIYLNQVFMGMFRPDSLSAPRWAGNLKQYQLGTFLGDIRLTDKNGDRAVSATTGFISACADSYWSSDSVDYWAFRPDAAGLCPADGGIYSDAPDGPVVEKGGAAQRLRGVETLSGLLVTTTTNYVSRDLKTCSGASASSCTSFTSFDTVNSAITASSLGAASSSERDALIHWVRGKDVDNENLNLDASDTPITDEVRPSVHGDVVHSEPAVVHYGSSTVAFCGANDGVFRAVDARKTDSAGNELWGFIAPETYGRLKRLRDNAPLVSFPNLPSGIVPAPRPKDYFFDGSVGVYQDASTAWIFPTMRRGGRAIYAFDVSNPASPSILWRRGCFTADTGDDSTCSTGWSSVGQTWSKPMVALIKDYPRPVLIFGGGYDTCEDLDSAVRCLSTARKGADIWFVDARTGDIIRRYTTHYSVPGQVALVKDVSGYLKYVYAGDTGGYVYRINVGSYDGASFAATNGVIWSSDASPDEIDIAYLSEPGSERKFLGGPDVVPYRGYNAVLIGSGDREHPLRTSYMCNGFTSSLRNQFYMIKDTPGAYPSILASPGNMTNVTTQLAITEAGISPRGWYFDLLACEQVVNRATTIGGITFFGTNQPSARATNMCTADLGIARGYAVNFLTANPADPLRDRATEFVGGGLPPSPVSGIVDLGVDGKQPFIIGGPGDSPIEASKILIDPEGKRHRVYWNQQID